MSLSKFNPVEPPWYGPVCPVVWEGWHREVSPYPDHRPKAGLPPACLDIRASDQDRDVSGGRGISSNTCSPGPSASAIVAATNAVFAFI